MKLEYLQLILDTAYSNFIFYSSLLLKWNKQATMQPARHSAYKRMVISFVEFQELMHQLFYLEFYTLYITIIKSIFFGLFLWVIFIYLWALYDFIRLKVIYCSSQVKQL